MVNDTRLKSISEVMLNIGVGFWLNFAINVTIFPHFGIPFDLGVYLQIGGFYTITSLIVQYPFRRLFNRVWKKQPVSGSMAETIVNFGVGWMFCYATGLIILPHYGMHSTLDVTIVNTIGSITTMIRRFLFRRLFEHFGPKENLYSLTIRLVHHVKKK